MKKLGILTFSLFGISALFAEVPTRFFVGNSEVTETFFKEIPDSLKRFTSEFDYDTIKIQSIELPITHYIDSVSESGGYIIKERSKDEVEYLFNRLRAINNNSEDLRLQVGDNVPVFSLDKFSSGIAENDFPRKGTCYLLSFWATWCGNCLAELMPDYLPAVAKEFTDNDRFRFIPVCIDSSSSELRDFFDGSISSDLAYLSETTYLDRDRLVNEIFATGGHIPLNVIIGPDGRVKYIHLGKITEKAELDALKEIIMNALSN